MNEQQIKEILDRYALGQATEADITFLESWYLQYGQPGQQELSMDARLESVDKVWSRLENGQEKRTRIIPLRRIAAAASLLLLLGAGYWWMYKPSGKTRATHVTSADIAPGKNAATLTLANGYKIILGAVGNGNIASQNGVAVNKAANGQLVYTAAAAGDGETGYNTLETGRGEQYQLVLPDGSHLWLNAASSVKYPVAFGKTDRTISLSGEAYFEIAPNATHPFIVTTPQQTVTVLGTKFNINTYTDEPSVTTTLLQGKVRVADQFRHQQVLQPGEQAVITGQSFSVVNTDADAAIAWKNGFFAFDESAITSVMRQISRWYNVSVKFEGKMPEDRFSGSIARSSNISQVLKKLELTDKVHFTIQDSTIIVRD